MKAHHCINYIVLSALLLLTFFATAQNSFKFGFKEDSSIIVKDSTGNDYKFPWTGGINAMHYSAIDLNLDGILDLVGYEIQGQKVMPFINNGTPGVIDYVYASEYISLFPNMVSWMKLIDYNQDGLIDIFCSGNGVIRVYKNISTSSTGLKFEFITPSINCDFGGTFPTSIFVSTVDYPSFADLDYDGDIDIVNFSELGAYVYGYKNLSMELYGDAEHFDFKFLTSSWGNFKENDTTNNVELNVTWIKSAIDTSRSAKGGIKHVGSTLLLMDYNNDSLYDLLLGDIDYLKMNMLTNGGTIDSAIITSQDITFPSYSDPIELNSFPAADYIDVDNDGTKELIISTFESYYPKTSSINNVQLYENTGTTSLPSFQFTTKNFLQGQMIDIGDNSSPALVDVNGDGLNDIVIGNYGRVRNSFYDSAALELHNDKIATLSYFLNIGTATQPSFQYAKDNWLKMDTLKLTYSRPTFGDLDGDLDMDMIVGDQYGVLIYFENTAGPGQMMTFAAPVRNYKNIDVGSYSSPQLFDINDDTLIDLVIGKKNGYISYYKNTGTSSNASFTLITDSMGKANVGTYYYKYRSYSAPCFYKDENDSLKLFVGSASGYTFYFEDITANILGEFKRDSNIVYYQYKNGFLMDSLFSVLQFENQGLMQQASDQGFRAIPAIGDLNNDGYPDIMVGSFTGGLKYYYGTTWPLISIENATEEYAQVTIFPNPAQDQVEIQISDLKIKSHSTHVKLYDLSGKCVFSKDYAKQNSIKLATSPYKNGVYLVEVNVIGNQKAVYIKTSKLIIQH